MLVADDPHLGGRVEQVGVALHAVALGVPVEQAGAVEELGELLRRHAGVLRERRCRELAADPGHLVAGDALGDRDQRLLQRLLPLDGDRHSVACVLRGVDDDQRVGVHERVQLERRSLAHPLQRRLGHPLARAAGVTAEGHAEQGVRVAPPDRAHDLLDEWPAFGCAVDDHLPAGLHAETGVDEQLGVAADPLVAHGQHNKTDVLFCKVPGPMPKISEAEKQQRMERILAGARRCFARHGYEGATVARLEQEIGLSRGAIFNWFPSKEELFVELARRDNERLLGLFAEEGFEALVRAMTEEDADWLAVYLEFGRRFRSDEAFRERWKERAAPDTRGACEDAARGAPGGRHDPRRPYGGPDRTLSRARARRHRRAARIRLRAARPGYGGTARRGRDSRPFALAAGRQLDANAFRPIPRRGPPPL